MAQGYAREVPGTHGLKDQGGCAAGGQGWLPRCSSRGSTRLIQEGTHQKEGAISRLIVYFVEGCDGRCVIRLLMASAR
jgi:hypothetical protein